MHFKERDINLLVGLLTENLMVKFVIGMARIRNFLRKENRKKGLRYFYIRSGQ